MSKRPLKASSRKKLEATMHRKVKQIESLHKLPPYTVIFSEGIKTEPYYIQSFTKQVNNKYSEFVTSDRIIVIGTGRNTRSLLDYTRKTIAEEYPSTQIVWLMYDKDDFPYDNFDNTQFSAEGRHSIQEYHVAWSNECVELWFILHFQMLFSNINRQQYHDILRGYFPYEKNLENIYDILKDKTPVAIEHSKKLYESYASDAPPSQRAPATRIHELVLFLQEYL